jgi:GR25 family glycosyltransferase involved in LPS biosynthesis
MPSVYVIFLINTCAALVIPKVAFIISTKGPPVQLTAQVSKFIPDVKQVQAIQDVNTTDLPFFTRHTMITGRYRPMEINTKQMVACFHSHALVWSMITESPSLVLEEDALIPRTIAIPYMPSEILMLTPAVIRGEPLGQPMFRYCNKYCTSGITPTNTAGYLITVDGAQRLLKHMQSQPMVIQLDTFIAMVSMYDDQFKQAWVVPPMVMLDPKHETTVQNTDPLLGQCDFFVSSYIILFMCGIMVGLLLFRKIVYNLFTCTFPKTTCDT